MSFCRRIFPCSNVIEIWMNYYFNFDCHVSSLWIRFIFPVSKLKRWKCFSHFSYDFVWKIMLRGKKLLEIDEKQESIDKQFSVNTHSSTIEKSLQNMFFIWSAHLLESSFLLARLLNFLTLHAASFHNEQLDYVFTPFSDRTLCRFFSFMMK